MIIERNTMLLVHNKNRGEFIAKARMSFSLDDEYYPLTVIDPMDARCIRGEEIMPRASATNIELLDEHVEDVAPEIEDADCDTYDTDESETEIAIETTRDIKNDFEQNGSIVSFIMN